MKRISIAIFSLVIFASMSNIVNYDSEKSSVDGRSSSDDHDGNYGKITAMYGDVGGPAITDENGGMGFGCIFLCSDEAWVAFISVIVIVGFLSYLVFRKVWKFVKRRIYRKSAEDGVDENVVEVNESLGGHLPVTEKEFFEFRVKEIKRRRKREDLEEEKEKVPISIKEEFILLSVFLFVIYLFWNNGI